MMPPQPRYDGPPMPYYPQYAPPPTAHSFHPRPRQPSSVPSNQMSPGGVGSGAIHPPAFVPLQVDHAHSYNYVQYRVPKSSNQVL